MDGAPSSKVILLFFDEEAEQFATAWTRFITLQ
jgi:hypothetical protein